MDNIVFTGFADEISQDPDTQIACFGKLGIRYIEMRGVDGNNLIYHDGAKVREIRKKLDDAGIGISALGSPLGKIGIDDPFEPHYGDFMRAVEIAHQMGTRYIRMFSFYVPGPEGTRDPAVREKVFERLGKFAEYAKAGGVCLLHENEKGIYGEKARECKEIMDAFGGEHFRAIFDFANFVQAGQDTPEAYELLKDHIAYVHIKDALRENGKVVPAGFGDGHVKEILERLLASGFSGFLSVEPHLFDFDGFAGLERGNAGLPSREEGEKPDGFETFSLAYRSITAIMEEIARSRQGTR